MQGSTICNMCGEEFNHFDYIEDRCFHTQFGYGSKYDGDYLDIDLCCKCFDKVVDWIIPQCKHNPLKERY